MIQDTDQKSQKKNNFTDVESPEKQSEQGNEQKGLSKEDVPDSTNESTGATGSGQRQDSN